MGGNQSSTSIKPNYIKNEQQIIKRAGDIIKQLKLDQSQSVVNQRQHLIARIVIYGHQHLIEHLRKFNHEQQKKFLRFLRNVDYQTVDLLFYKLVKNVRIQKKRQDYTSYNFIDKRTFKKQKQDYFCKKGHIVLGLGQSQKQKVSKAEIKSKTGIAKFISKKKIFDVQKQQQLQKQLQKQNKSQQKQKNMIGLIVFMGGQSTRFSSQKGKQIYKENQEQQCIFQVIMKQLKQLAQSLISKIQSQTQINQKNKGFLSQECIQKLKQKFPQVYLICNQRNARQISVIVKNFTQPPLQSNIPQQFQKPANEINQLAFMSKISNKFILCMQNTQPIVNLNGKICLTGQKLFQIVQMPNGCGDFIKSTVKFQRSTIIEDMRKKNIKYVHCIGCQNYLAQVLDPFMLGYLVQNKQQCDVVFKCTYAQKQDQDFLRVVYRQQKKCIKINNFEQLIETSSKRTDPDVIRKSPVWINSIMFSLQKFEKYLQSLKMSPQLVHMFNAQKRKVKYWDPISQFKHNKQYCFVFERYLSDILVHQKLKAVGIMVQRQQQFLPVIGKDEKDDEVNNWKQAYKQYINRQKKHSVLKQVHIGMISLVSMMSQQADQQSNNFRQKNLIDEIIQ